MLIVIIFCCVVLWIAYASDKPLPKIGERWKRIDGSVVVINGVNTHDSTIDCKSVQDIVHGNRCTRYKLILFLMLHERI